MAGMPSFSCDKTGKIQERLICNSDHLSELDVQLSDYYSDLMRTLSEDKKTKLRESQIVWLRQRDKFCQNEACLKGIYQKRIKLFANQPESLFDFIAIEDNRYIWSYKAWQRYIYDQGFIRCGDDPESENIFFDKVESYKFNYRTVCNEPPDDDHGWYDLDMDPENTWDNQHLTLKTIGTPEDYVILITVSGTAASNAWDKTLVYKKEPNRDGGIVAAMIGWVPYPGNLTAEKFTFDTDGWKYAEEDSMCCPSSVVFSKIEITREGVRALDRKVVERK